MGATKQKAKTRKRSQPRASAAEASGRAREEAEARRRFERELVVRGEAVVPNEDGSLPPNATHAIIVETEEGAPRLERRRFSAS